MTPGQLLQRFLAEEASLDLVDMILGILGQRTSGVEYHGSGLSHRSTRPL